MSKQVELVLSNTYVYKGKVFEKNNPYVVSDADAGHLLSQKNERDIPYFRLTESESPMLPPSKRTDKGGVARPVEMEAASAEDVDAEMVDEEAEDDADAVTV
jgi:hypothetical protein